MHDLMNGTFLFSLIQFHLYINISNVVITFETVIITNIFNNHK